MKKITLLLLCVLTTVGCKHEARLGFDYYTKHFIDDYTIADRIECVYDYVTINETSFSIKFGGIFVDEDSNPKKYHRLEKRYDDVSYDRRKAPPGDSALANELMDISVVSDADYDNLHPAGTPLDDIIIFKSESYYPYISTKYVGQEKTLINKPLNGLLADDMKLLRTDGKILGSFLFSTPPTLSRKHNITLTVTDADGSKFTATKLIDFDNTSSQ